MFASVAIGVIGAIVWAALAFGAKTSRHWKIRNFAGRLICIVAVLSGVVADRIISEWGGAVALGLMMTAVSSLVVVIPATAVYHLVTRTRKSSVEVGS